MTSPAQLLQQIDPHYFLDYAIFTGAVRNYASKTLEEAFRKDPNDLRRRLHFLNLLKEEYAAYEDTGAMLNALLDFRAGKVDVPIASLIEFKARDVELANVFECHKIDSGDRLFKALKLEEWVPPAWSDWFPKLDIQKSLKLACDFFVNDCAGNQKRLGIIAYNKVKHGLLAVPSGRVYRPNLPDGPAVIFPSPRAHQEAGGSPYAVLGFEATDEQIENRHTSVEFVQCNLRLLAGLYVVSRYPEVLKARGIGEPRDLFSRGEWSDVRHLIEEVTKKK